MKHDLFRCKVRVTNITILNIVHKDSLKRIEFFYEVDIYLLLSAEYLKLQG